MYGMLEDFLPHDEWLVLNEFDRLIKIKDSDEMLKASNEFRQHALQLMKQTTERYAQRASEFKQRLQQLDEAKRRP